MKDARWQLTCDELLAALDAGDAAYQRLLERLTALEATPVPPTRVCDVHQVAFDEQGLCPQCWAVYQAGMRCSTIGIDRAAAYLAMAEQQLAGTSAQLPLSSAALSDALLVVTNTTSAKSAALLQEEEI